MKKLRFRLLILLIFFYIISLLAEIKISKNLYIDKEKLSKNFQQIKIEITTETVNTLGKYDGLIVKVLDYSENEKLTATALVNLYGIGFIFDNDEDGFKINSEFKEYLKNNIVGKTLNLYYSSPESVRILNLKKYGFITNISDAVILDLDDIALNIEFLKYGFVDYIYPIDNYRFLRKNSWKYEYIYSFNNNLGYWSEIYGAKQLINEEENKIIEDTIKNFVIMTRDTERTDKDLLDYVVKLYEQIKKQGRTRYKHKFFDMLCKFIDDSIFLKVAEGEKKINRYQRYYFYIKLKKILEDKDFTEFKNFLEDYYPVLNQKISESKKDFQTVKIEIQKKQLFDELMAKADDILENTAMTDERYRVKIKRAIDNYTKALELTDEKAPIYSKIYRAYIKIHDSYTKNLQYKMIALQEAEKYRMYANSDIDNYKKFEQLESGETIKQVERLLAEAGQYYNLILEPTDENSKKCFDYYSKAIEKSPKYEYSYIKLAAYYLKLYNIAKDENQKNDYALKYKKTFSDYYTLLTNDKQRAEELAELELLTLITDRVNELLILSRRYIDKLETDFENAKHKCLSALNNLYKLSKYNETIYELYFEFYNKILPKSNDYRGASNYFKSYADIYKNYLIYIKKFDNDSAYKKSLEFIYDKYINTANDWIQKYDESSDIKLSLISGILKDAQILLPENIQTYRLENDLYKICAKKAETEELKKTFLEKSKKIMDDYYFIISQKKY